MSTPALTKKRKRDVVSTKTVQFKKPATQAAVNGTSRTSSSQPAAYPSPDTAREPTTPDQAIPPPADAGLGQDIHIQIVSGSYERVLHGVSATIPRRSLSRSNGTSETAASFSDTFLFAAHSSSIRCLAISPPTSSGKRTLATGGSDERVNLYSISTAPPARKASKAPSLLSSSTSANARNRSLGNLLHHDRAVTGLHFPSKAKLFSAAEDNTVAISRTRDWTMLSSIRAPIPKPQGRPSGDTAGPGEVPAGVNDFAVHPSQKLMLSVGRGEKCMRLWNLMTGKKAGVLSFAREVLAQVGEGRFSAGEGRKVLWDAKGEVYVVGFERGAVVFGIDSTPKAVVKPDRPTKFHQMRFLPGDGGAGGSVLVVSTEDGRLLFFDLTSSLPEHADAANLPQSPCLAQLGGRAAGLAGRIKDFEILQPKAQVPAPGEEAPLLIVTASSDGAVRIWSTTAGELRGHAKGPDSEQSEQSPVQVERLIGTLETSKRITCMTAFMLDGEAVDETNGTADFGAAEDEEAKSGSEDDEDGDSE